MDLDPLPSNAEMQEKNIYVVAPGKEGIISRECVAETQNGEEGPARNPYPMDEQGSRVLISSFRRPSLALLSYYLKYLYRCYLNSLEAVDLNVFSVSILAFT